MSETLAIETARALARKRAREQAGGPPVLIGRILFGIAAISLYVICQFWKSLGMTWGPGTSASLALTFFVVHVLLLRRRVGAVDPIVWLPVSFLLFYFGTAFSVEVVGFDENGLGYDAWQQGGSLNMGRGYCTALLTMTAFIFGMYLAGARDLTGGPDPDRPHDESLTAPALAFTLGALLMTLFGIALVGPSTAFGLYSDWWAAKAAGADQRFLDIGVIFTEAGIFAIIASAAPRQRLLRGFAYTVAAAIAVITVQKGDRSGLVALAIGVGWCYSQRVKRIRWAPVLVAAFFLFLLLPILAEWRSTRTIDSREAGIQTLVGASAYGMGSSVNAFVHTLDYLPGLQTYQWGLSYWAGMVNAIPNLLPTKGANPLHFTSIESSPSNWLTRIVAPEWAATGGGYGYAMGAEAYYNFGMPGVLIISILFGYLAGRVRNRAQASDFGLVASAVFFGALAILVRNAFGHPFKFATWPLIALALTRFMMKGMQRRRGPSPVLSSGFEVAPAGPVEPPRGPG